MSKPTRKGGATLTPARLAKNLATQLVMNPQTIAQLRTFGVTPKTKKKLMFAFSTSTKPNALDLVQALESLGYTEVEAYKQDNAITVEGWTGKLLIARATIDAWVREMCRIGSAHNALFEGWSTSSDA